MKRDRWILLSLVFIGLFMRAYLAHTAPAHADETIINARAIGIIEAQRISTIDQMPLYHWMLDGLYLLLGSSYFTARIPSVIFGALLPILVYLLGRHFFERNAAMLGASLCAFSPYLLRFQAESNTTMTFFALLGLVLFFEGFKTKHNGWMVLSFVFLGIATLIKTITLMILIALIIIIFVQRKHSVVSSQATGTFFYAVLFLPILAHNLILYSQKGILDMLFVRYFPVAHNPYLDLLNNAGISFEKLILSIKEFAILATVNDPLTSLLSISGVFFVIWISYRHRQIHSSWLLLITLLIVLLFLLSSSLMAKHYVTVIALLCIFGGSLCARLFRTENSILAFVVVFAISSAAILSPLMTKDPGIALDDIAASLAPDSLVIADNRIYRGAYLFPFANHAIIGAMHFVELEEYSLTKPREDLINTSVYFVECVPDDCTGSQSHQANITLERITASFAHHGHVIAQVPQQNPVYRIHQSSAMLIKNAGQQSWAVGNFFFHTIGWRYPQTIVDWYVPEQGWQEMIHTLSLMVLWVSLILVIVGIVITLMFWTRIR